MSDIKILEKIGQGSYGKVFSCTRGEEKLVIKKQDRYAHAYLCEAIFLSSFKHKNIVELRGLSDNNMLLPLYDSSLWNVNVKNIKFTLWELVQGIKAIHDAGYIHRDLTRSNILINHEQGEVTSLVIADFGLCSRANFSTSLYVQTCSVRAPELYLKRRYSNKIDIWSLGCIIYHIVLLYELYPEGINSIQIVASEHYLSSIQSIQDESLRDLVTNCLRFDPMKRYDINQVISHHYFDDIRTELIPVQDMRYKITPISLPSQRAIYYALDKYHKKDEDMYFEYIVSMFYEIYPQIHLNTDNIITCLFILLCVNDEDVKVDMVEKVRGAGTLDIILKLLGYKITIINDM